MSLRYWANLARPAAPKLSPWEFAAALSCSEARRDTNTIRLAAQAFSQRVLSLGCVCQSRKFQKQVKTAQAEACPTACLDFPQPAAIMTRLRFQYTKNS